MEDQRFGVYLDGDPDTESTRRHMERVLTGGPRRRWPWLLGLFAGGTALAFWRVRRTRRENGRETDRLVPGSLGLGPAAARPGSAAGAPELRRRLSRAGGR